MKVFLAVLSLIFTSQAFAKGGDVCLDVLSQKFETMAKKSSDWGYEGIASLSHKDAKWMIREALAEDEEKDRAVMQNLVGQKNVLFYTLQWNAPSNTGTTIIAADKNTCDVIEDLLFYSEE
ncbi:hypothetical protein [Bdellovibrio bacteriovorus]|uniref:hypothetical protein n=1 Tax=Bdellovibrio TaxID=958 RepID=UPI0035A9876B